MFTYENDREMRMKQANADPREPVNEQGRQVRVREVYDHMELMYISMGVPYFRGCFGVSVLLSWRLQKSWLRFRAARA